MTKKISWFSNTQGILFPVFWENHINSRDVGIINTNNVGTKSISKCVKYVTVIFFVLRYITGNTDDTNAMDNNRWGMFNPYAGMWNTANNNWDTINAIIIEFLRSYFLYA